MYHFILAVLGAIFIGIYSAPSVVLLVHNFLKENFPKERYFNGSDAKKLKKEQRRAIFSGKILFIIILMTILSVAVYAIVAGAISAIPINEKTPWFLKAGMFGVFWKIFIFFVSLYTITTIAIINFYFHVIAEEISNKRYEELYKSI